MSGIRHMTALRILATLAFTTLAATASALDLPSGTKLQDSQTSQLGSARLATARFNGETVPTLSAEGQMLRQAWKLESTSQTSFQVLVALRDQLLQDGYEVLFQCQSVSCGGYDFRFDIGHFKAPTIFVDLGDYHYLSARKGDAHTSILVSRTGSDAFIELTQIFPQDVKPVTNTTSAVSTVAPEGNQGPVGSRLETQGRIVLRGVAFTTGSAALADGDVPVLADLARYLNDNPTRKIVLVGHTDAEGSLDGNIALSRKRAVSVMNNLIERYDVKAGQVSAQGVGFLLPLAANLTPEGRDKNRRVEAVLISTN